MVCVGGVSGGCVVWYERGLRRAARRQQHCSNSSLSNLSSSDRQQAGRVDAAAAGNAAAVRAAAASGKRRARRTRRRAIAPSASVGRPNLSSSCTRRHCLLSPPLNKAPIQRSITHDLVARQDLLGDDGRQAAQHMPAGVDHHSLFWEGVMQARCWR